MRRFLTLAPAGLATRILALAAAAAAILLAAVSAGQAQDLRIEQVTTNTYALVGPLGQRDPQNLGNNATFGLIVTDAGAVLIDAGGSYKGAAALAAVIATITDQPVRIVFNSGGQDHRWLGNGYWREHGARIIASEAALADQADRASMQLSALAAMIGPEALAGTEPVFAGESFGEEMVLEFGGETMVLHHGTAHTPGDSTLWLASQSVMFTGDLVYRERILGVGPQSSSRDWVASFGAMAAREPAHIVPGHGSATDLAGAKADTLDYLLNLRARIGALIEAGGDMLDAPKVDQSAFAYLVNFDMLAGRNAQEVFSQMEWE